MNQMQDRSKSSRRKLFATMLAVIHKSNQVSSLQGQLIAAQDRDLRAQRARRIKEVIQVVLAVDEDLFVRDRLRHLQREHEIARHYSELFGLGDGRRCSVGCFFSNITPVNIYGPESHQSKHYDRPYASAVDTAPDVAFIYGNAE